MSGGPSSQQLKLTRINLEESPIGWSIKRLDARRDARTSIAAGTLASSMVIWSTQVTTKSVAISTFKARCLALLEDVARTGEPLLVTKRGKPLARVMASDNSRSSSPQDTLWHTVETLDDIIAPVVTPSAWNATRGVMLTQDDPGRAREQGRRRSGRHTRPRP